MKFRFSHPAKHLRRLWYMPILGLAMALMLVRTLVMAKLLTVENFAEFNVGLLISSTFGMLGALGLQYLLQRDMPVQIFHGRERAAAILLMQNLFVTLMCFLAVLTLVTSGLLSVGFSARLLSIGVLHGLSQQMFLLATIESRSRGRPLLFANQNLVRASIALTASISMALWLETAEAALIAEAIVSLLLAHNVLRGVWQRANVKVPALCRLALRRLKQVPWSTAMALLAVSFAGFFLLNADRWIAAYWLPPVAFAQYSFGWILLMIAQSLQVVINASVFPALARRYAGFGSYASFRMAAKLSFGLLFACAIVSWPIYWVLDMVVVRWFPTYSDVRQVLGAFLLVAILRISDFWTSHLVIIGREKRLLAMNLAVGTLGCASWFYFFEPDSGGFVEIGDVVWLAVILAVSGYLSGFSNAWAVRS